MSGIPESLEDYELVRPLGDGQYLCLGNLTLGRKRVIVSTEDFAGEHW